MSKTKVIKRNGVEKEDFNPEKIFIAITKAMSVSGQQNQDIAFKISKEIEETLSGEELVYITEIENLVYYKLIENDLEYTAKKYEGYRAVQEYKRYTNPLDENIIGIIDGTNEYELRENSNKNGYSAGTQRDLIAGQYSRDWTRRKLLPPDIMEAHDEGLIHFHDSDYELQHVHNCCLINLKDCFENGTVINETLIETPKSFRTACTVATQISQQVSCGQYGGQTWSVAHLAPYLRLSYNKIKAKKKLEWDTIGFTYTEEDLESATQVLLHEELKDGVQTIQYQIITMNGTNGQAPFLSVFMYLNEEPEYIKETAMIIEEILKQRIQGVKNRKGVYITPAFPKLLYVLDANNITEDSEYWYLTKIAAECVSRRMVPDFISAKIMRQNYDGEVVPNMGCCEGNEIVTYKYNNKLYVESFKRMWDRLSESFEVKHQYNDSNPNLYMDLDNILIYDTLKGFVNTQRIIRNVSNKWVKVHMSNGRLLTCTEDHPFAINNKGRILAKDLQIGDEVTINHNQITESSPFNWDKELAWAYGLILCDSSINNTRVTVSLALNSENDIIDKFIKIIKTHYNTEATVKELHREKKGNYKDVSVNSKQLAYDCIRYFEGINKDVRHIPNCLFSMNYEVRLNFLAGMIDADGYVNSNMDLNKIQIGSTNKELALQQLALIQSLGMPAYIYENHYSKEHPEKIRYRIECVPIEELIIILCDKKRNMFTNNIRKSKSINTTEFANIKSIEYLSIEDYSYDVTTDSDHFEVSGIYSHNCRSFLGLWKDPKTNKYKWYGRFNQGVVTINLADVGLSAHGDYNLFWEILDNRLELCKRALMIRHERLKGTSTNISSIHFRDGVLARLGEDDTIDELLYGGYSSISLGYAALYECVLAMTGKSHTDESSTPFALEIMNHLKDKCNEWKEETNIGFSLYGSPIENTTYKFAKCLKKRFGIIPGITDRNFVTNSYHVFVEEHINPFDKLKFESQFQHISSGGAISYIESDNMVKNTEAILQIMQYMYETIQYAEINSKFDYCQVCEYTGEILIDDNNKWYCPNCGNRDQKKMNCCRRTCGYLGTNFWSEGRTEEIKNRFMHLANHDVDFSYEIN